MSDILDTYFSEALKKEIDKLILEELRYPNVKHCSVSNDPLTFKIREAKLDGTFMDLERKIFFRKTMIHLAIFAEKQGLTLQEYYKKLYEITRWPNNRGYLSMKRGF